MSEFSPRPEIINSTKYSDEEIRRFYDEISFADFEDEFARYLETRLDKDIEVKNEIGKRLASKNLVDLGCGPDTVSGLNIVRIQGKWQDNDLPYIIRLAKQFEVNGYTGVDFSNEFRRWARNIIKNDEESEKLSKSLGLNVKFVYDEMLHYIHSLPDNSVCYTMNGIATELIQGAEKPLPETSWYKALLEELHRTMATEGVLFGTDSGVLKHEKLVEAGFKPLREGFDCPADTYAYIK